MFNVHENVRNIKGRNYQNMNKVPQNQGASFFALNANGDVTSLKENLDLVSRVE